MNDVARIAVAAWIVLVFVGQQVIGIATLRSGKPTKKPITTTELTCRFVAAVVLADYTLGIHGVPRGFGMPVPVRIFGLVLVAAGLCLSLQAQRELGANWVAGVGLYERHSLITTGVYSRLRNPMYTGFGVSLLGLILVAANYAVLIGTAFLWLVFLIRLPYEELLLLERFPVEYEAYKCRAGIIFPRVRQKRSSGVIAPAPASVVVPMPPRPPTNVARRDRARRERARRR